MSLFKSSNPVMKESSFDGTIFSGLATGEVMTVKGTMNKLGILFLAMFVTTVFSWKYAYAGNNPMPLLIIGVFGGLALALIITFKKQWAPFLAPLYALCEGLFVGAVSAVYDASFKTTYPGLVAQAVLLTLVVTLVMFLLFRYRIIRVTDQFRKIIVIATISLAVFYLSQWIVFLITGSNYAPFTNASSPLGIGFSVVVVALAALNLLLNFDTIEKGVEKQAPKFMEWYGAFGLLVTLVWLYLEILRLLSKFANR